MQGLLTAGAVPAGLPQMQAPQGRSPSAPCPPPPRACVSSYCSYPHMLGGLPSSQGACSRAPWWSPHFCAFWATVHPAPSDVFPTLNCLWGWLRPEGRCPGPGASRKCKDTGQLAGGMVESRQPQLHPLLSGPCPHPIEDAGACAIACQPSGKPSPYPWESRGSWSPVPSPRALWQLLRGDTEAPTLGWRKAQHSGFLFFFAQSCLPGLGLAGGFSTSPQQDEQVPSSCCWSGVLGHMRFQWSPAFLPYQVSPGKTQERQGSGCAEAEPGLSTAVALCPGCSLLTNRPGFV